MAEKVNDQAGLDNQYPGGALRFERAQGRLVSKDKKWKRIDIIFRKRPPNSPPDCLVELEEQFTASDTTQTKTPKWGFLFVARPKRLASRRFFLRYFVALEDKSRRSPCLRHAF